MTHHLSVKQKRRKKQGGLVKSRVKKPNGEPEVGWRRPRPVRKGGVSEGKKKGESAPYI